MIDGQVAEGRRRKTMRSITSALTAPLNIAGCPRSVSFYYFEVSDPDECTFDFLQQTFGVGLPDFQKRPVHRVLKEVTGSEPAVVELAGRLPFISIVNKHSGNAADDYLAVVKARHCIASPGTVIASPEYGQNVVECLEDGGWVVDGRVGDGGIAWKGDILCVAITFEAGSESASSAISLPLFCAEPLFYAV